MSEFPTLILYNIYNLLLIFYLVCLNGPRTSKKATNIFFRSNIYCNKRENILREKRIHQKEFEKKKTHKTKDSDTNFYVSFCCLFVIFSVIKENWFKNRLVFKFSIYMTATHYFKMYCIHLTNFKFANCNRIEANKKKLIFVSEESSSQL